MVLMILNTDETSTETLNSEQFPNISISLFQDVRTKHYKPAACAGCSPGRREESCDTSGVGPPGALPAMLHLRKRVSTSLFIIISLNNVHFNNFSSGSFSYWKFPLFCISTT